jgi:hypothetical protein
VSQALVALDDVLSPGIRDALLRYAPPLASARTVVTQSAAGRTAHYELSLYAPSAAATTERVQAMVARLQELPAALRCWRPATTRDMPGARYHHVRLPSRQ